LIDLHSSNGTYVNEMRISEVEIVSGDLVYFGKASARFDGLTFLVSSSLSSDSLERRRRGPSKIFQRPLILVSVCLAIGMVFQGWKLMAGARSAVDISRATVQILVEDSFGKTCWTGSGALTGRGGFVVTNAHVAAYSEADSPELSDCTRLKVGFSDESGLAIEYFVEASIGAIDEDRDLAILELEGEPPGKLPKSLDGYSGPIELGDEIRVFGYPSIGGESLTVSSGIVSGVDRSDRYSYYKVTADISAGNSGGPVVDSRGRLIGIATAIRRQRIDCSSNDCYSEGNSLGLVRPVALLSALYKEVGLEE
jgi:S1-C subfamily serine protease